jgi:hypothetical protein
MTLVQRIDSLLATWRVLLPHIPAPTPENATRWLHYPDTAVEAAILRTAQKFAAPKLVSGFEPLQAYRYTTSTARNMAARALAETGQSRYVRSVARNEVKDQQREMQDTDPAARW